MTDSALRDECRFPRAARRAAGTRGQVLRGAEHAAGRAVGARGLQVDLLDPAGRASTRTCGPTPAEPRFVDIVGPYKKWGGDNADAFYQYAPIDPQPHVPGARARRGDAVYLSLTVYGGPERRPLLGAHRRHGERPRCSTCDGRRVVFEFARGSSCGRRTTRCARSPATTSSTRRPAGGWSGRSRPSTRRHVLPRDDADLARRFTRRAHVVREQAKIVPLRLGEPNAVEEPYPVPTTTFGWAAGDAAYAMGSFDLADDEALVIEGRSPECAFWNLCLWNPFLHTYNYDYERVTINGGQVEYEADGSWTIVVAERDPGHPTGCRPQGHPRGRIWFRWFLPGATPERSRPRSCSSGSSDQPRSSPRPPRSDRRRTGSAARRSSASMPRSRRGRRRRSRNFPAGGRRGTRPSRRASRRSSAGRRRRRCARTIAKSSAMNSWKRTSIACARRGSGRGRARRRAAGPRPAATSTARYRAGRGGRRSCAPCT